MAGATSQAERQAQVLAAGYNGPMTDAAVNQAYANAATSSDLASSGIGQTPQSNGANPGNANNPSSPANTAAQNYANVQAGQMLLNAAQQAANQAYLNAKLQLDTDQEAYQKAAQEAATEIAKAGVTGTYNGMPTQAAIKQAADIAQQQAQTMVSYATQFGAWGMPQQGQQTLAAQQQQFTQGQQAAELTGWYTPYTYTPPQMGTPGQGIGFSSPAATPGITVGGAGGLQGGSQTWNAVSEQLKQLAGSNYNDAAAKAAYQQAVGADPNNFNGGQQQNLSQAQMNTIAAAGGVPQAQPAQAQGGQPGAAGQGSVTYGAPPGYQAGQPIQTLQAQQQNYNQWLQAQNLALSQWQAQQGATQNYLNLLSNLRGPADYAKYQQVLGSTPGGMKDLVAAAAGQYIPGGGATTGVQPQAANLNTLYQDATGQNTTGQQQVQQAQSTLVAPNQMAPQTWNALQPSQQQMLLGIWESQGYTKEDAQNLFNQSLPKYATQGPSVGGFKLQ